MDCNVVSRKRKEREKNYIDLEEGDSFTVHPNFVSDIRKIVSDEKDIALVKSVLSYFCRSCITDDKNQKWSYSMNVSADSTCEYQLWMKNLDSAPDVDILSKMMTRFEDDIRDITIVFPDILKNRMDTMVCVYLPDSTKKKKTRGAYVLTRWRKNFFEEKMRKMLMINSELKLSSNIESHIKLLSFISDVINNKDEFMKNLDTHLSIDMDKNVYEVKFVGIDKISLSALCFIESFEGQKREDIDTIRFKATTEHIHFGSMDKNKSQVEVTFSVMYI